MEDDNRWFKDDKKGKPLIEKFAMLFFGFLMAKYAVKAIKSIPKGKKIKIRWWMFFLAVFLEGIFMMVDGEWDINNFWNNVGVGAVFIISVFLFSLIEGKSF